MHITASEMREMPWTEAAAPSGREEESAPLLAPYVLLRITGLSFEALEQLRFPQTVALMEEILEIEDWLEERRTSLLDRLGALLPQLPERALQHKCMDLRRAIAGARGQRADTLLQTLAPALPPEFVEELERWSRQARRRADLLVAGEPTLQRELTACRQRLRQILRNEDFQRGLLLSSPTLYTELQHYLAAPAQEWNNRLRRTEEGLLSYLMRMITKPSPYSTFTSTTPGSWDSNEKQLLHVEMADWSQQSVIRLHTGLLHMLLQVLARCPEVSPYLRPRLNSTIRWLPAEQEAPDLSGPPDDLNRVGKIEFFVYRQEQFPRLHYDERLVRLRLNAPTRAILQALLSGGEALTSQEVIARALELSRQEESTQSGVEQEMSAALDYLVSKGVVIRELELPENEDDKLAWVCARLATLPGAWTAQIQEKFQAVRVLLVEYACAAAEQRFTLLRDVREHLLELSRAIAPDAETAQELEAALTRHSSSLLLEDSIRQARELTLGPSAWAPLFPGLRALQKMASLLSVDSIWHLISTTLGSHIARSSREKDPAHRLDLIAYHHLLSQQVTRPDRLHAHLYWREIFPRLLQLRDLRRDFATTMQARLREASTRGERVLSLSSTEIDAFAGTLPSWLHQHSSLAHFCQLFFEENTPGLVINSTWSGAASAFSRFGYILQRWEAERRGASAANTLGAYIAELGRRHGVIYSSIAETGNFNVNTHLAVAPYEILFPASVSLLPRERQLTLRDLYVEPVADGARSGLSFYTSDLERPICPIHMGYSITMSMSPLYQTLLTPGSVHPAFDLIALVEAHLLEEHKNVIRHYPRVAIEGVVLNREMWKVPRACLPLREASESAFDYFLKVNRWRRTQGLPREVFRRAQARSEFQIQWQQQYLERLLEKYPSGTQGEQDSLPEKLGLLPENLQALYDDDLRKPFYVDFHNYFLVKMLGEALENLPEEQGLTFAEMLPSRQQALVQQEGREYASELIIELVSESSSGSILHPGQASTP